MVPQPERCELDSILPLGTGNYWIACIVIDDNTLPDYLDLLTEAGFEEDSKMVGLDDEMILVIMNKDTITIQLTNLTIDSDLTIHVEAR